jgi:hypothetical protein
MEGKASENPNMETSIGSEIMRDEQSIAPRWATKWKIAINQNKKVNEAFAEKPTSLLLELKTMESLVILRLVTAIGSDDVLSQFMMTLKAPRLCQFDTANAALIGTVG